MEKQPDREAAIDAMLAELRRRLESELPDDNATLDQIEDAAYRIGLEVQRGLRQHLVPASQEGAPEWLPETEEAIRQLIVLPLNWNSYGAQVVDPRVVASAIELLRKVVHRDTPRPSVAPTGRGGVQLEWHTRGIDLEIELTSPKKIQVYYEDATEEAEWELAPGSDLGRLADLVARLSHAQ